MRAAFSSWKEASRRLWFALRTLATRARFFTGKASFVEADVRMTTNSVAEGGEAAAKGAGARLFSHYQLSTRKPRTGTQGWRLFKERVGEPGAHKTVRLECGYCGHQFIIQVLKALDPLASETTGGKAPGQPASYSSDWFKFMHEDYKGTPSLYCLHCEQNGAPKVEFLEAAPGPEARAS